MACEREIGVQSPEVSRVILIDGNDTAIEVRAHSDAGRRFLNGFGASLLAAIEVDLLKSGPFTIDRPETTLPTPEQLIERPTVPTMITVEHTLELATAAYRAKPYSPELLNEYNQSFWDVRRQRMKLSKADLVVADCPYSEADIREFRRNDFGLFVPQIVSTAPEGLILLSEGFPQMGSSAFQKRTGVLNIDKNGGLVDIHGWMTTEKAIDAPYIRTNQGQAERIIERKHRIGDTLNVYGVAGQQSKELTGKYLDEVRTWIRTLSSRLGSQVLNAIFSSNGLCYVHWDLKPGGVSGYLGARSVEVAKT